MDDGWLPNDLISENTRLHLESLRERSIVFDCLTDTKNAIELKPMWRSIKRHAKSDDYGYDFVMACELGYSNTPRMTKKGRQNKSSEITRVCTKLIELCEEFSTYTSSLSVIDLLTEKEKECYKIQGLLKAPPTRTGGIKFPGRELDISGALDIKEILKRLAVNVEQRAVKTPIVSQPNAEKSHIRAFCRIVTICCREMYGKPLPKVVATAATAIFQEPISDDYVRER